MASLLEEILKGFANAITDVREKAVEEPWFGRAVTEPGNNPAPQWPQAREPQSPEQTGPDRNKSFNEGIDR